MQICSYWYNLHKTIASPGFIFERTNSLLWLHIQPKPLMDSVVFKFHFSVCCPVNRLINIYSYWSFTSCTNNLFSSLTLTNTVRHVQSAGWHLTLMPSMRKPRVAVELSVSLHCMYLGLRTPCWVLSCSVGAPGSTATIFSYMSFRKRGRSLAFISSSSKYVLMWEKERLNI